MLYLQIETPDNPDKKPIKQTQYSHHEIQRIQQNTLQPRFGCK